MRMREREQHDEAQDKAVSQRSEHCVTFTASMRQHDLVKYTAAFMMNFAQAGWFAANRQRASARVEKALFQQVLRNITKGVFFFVGILAESGWFCK